MTDRVTNKILGYIGFGVLTCSFLGAFLGNKFFKIWITPLSWLGYIFFVDYIVFRIKGKSLFSQNKEGFLWLWILSCPLWLIFEYYNLLLGSWTYTGLPSFRLTVLGMYISFSAILPALFETASLVNCIFRLDNVRIRPLSSSRAKLVLLIFLGVVCLILPLMFPTTHLYALIWLGFLLLLDPVNYLLGLPSFLGERRDARIYRFFSFLIGGYICGFLWEFWNWYAYASWTYDVPFLQNIKIFQMPVLGFLGFGPFSLEMFCMYYFTWYILRKAGIVSSPHVEI